MAEEKPEFLTVRELAALLRVKERKVYALAAEGEVPCNRATGKLLFPRAGVEAWIERHGSSLEPYEAAKAAPAVFAGSHDPLLDWALRESRCGMATYFDGSLDGLARLKRGEAMAAGMHVVEAGPSEWNVRHVEEALASAPAVVLEWAWRDRGLVTAPGNPKDVRRLSDLAGLRFVPRQPEAGSQILFDELVGNAALSAGDLELVEPPARSETDVAVAVIDGKADAGFGLAGLAQQFRLDFVPVARERYDIVVFRRAYFEEPFQRFLQFCRTAALDAKARDMGGYDVSGLGRVHYNGP